MRANKAEIHDLAIALKKIINSLSYYNDDAKKNEINKYTEQELTNKIEQDPDSVIIAKSEEEILGFCLSRQDDRLIWLEWFGVIEKARRQGVARKLVQYLENTIRNRNAHKIWCDCRTENLKSVNLLSSSGYTPICTLKNHWYGQDFILWQKEIA